MDSVHGYAYYILTCGISNAVDLVYTVWQHEKAGSRSDHIVVVCLLNLMGKLFGSDKLIALINEHNTVLNRLENSFPCSSRKNAARLLAAQFNAATLAHLVILADHINQRRFTRCTISPKDR